MFSTIIPLTIGYSKKHYITVNSPNNSSDGEWIKTFDKSLCDRAWSVQQTSDGGYILAGRTERYNPNIWLIKTDIYGNEEWNKTFGGTDGDRAWSVQQTMDGGYIITGATQSYGDKSDMWLIKTDFGGNEEWNKTYGGTDGDGGMSVQQTTDGGYIIAGCTSSYGAGESDVWLVKTDSSGNEQWNTTIGTIGTDYGWSVDQTDDGGYIIVGDTFLSSDKSDDVWLIKMDADGNEEWNKTFGGTWEDYGRSVQQTTDGGYVFAGSTGSYGAGSVDVWLVKTDASGNEVWNRTYGWIKYELGHSIQQTTEGGYILVGSKWAGNAYDVYLIKTDNDGYKLWDKTFGIEGEKIEDIGCSVQQTTDSGYIITGYTGPDDGSNNDVLLIKAAAFENQRPSIPIITGPTKGRKWEEIEYTFVSTDPDGDDLYYYIDWGEYEAKGWIGPNSSGVPIKVSYWWRYKGIYTIRAKVEDVHGGESDWATFEVEIEGRKGREVQQMLFYRWLEHFPLIGRFISRITNPLR